LHGGALGRFRHVIDQNKTDGDVAGLGIVVGPVAGADARRIKGEDAIATEDLSTDRESSGKVYLDDMVHALPTGDVPETLHGVFSPVVDVWSAPAARAI